MYYRGVIRIVFKEILEHAYYISSILLLAGVIVAIRQLYLMKKDYKSRNDRAAVEKSIEYLSWFSASFFSKRKEIEDSLDEKLLLKYDEEWGSDFKFNDKFNIHTPGFIKSVTEKASKNSNTEHLLNELEYVCAAFVSGLADEELAYNPVSGAFIRFVESNYDIICLSRDQINDKLYSNVVDLYKMWSTRDKHLEASEKLEKALQEVHELHNQPKRKSL